MLITTAGEMRTIIVRLNMLIYFVLNFIALPSHYYRMKRVLFGKIVNSRLQEGFNDSRAD